MVRGPCPRRLARPAQCRGPRLWAEKLREGAYECVSLTEPQYRVTIEPSRGRGSDQLGLGFARRSTDDRLQHRGADHRPIFSEPAASRAASGTTRRALASGVVRRDRDRRGDLAADVVQIARRPWPGRGLARRRRWRDARAATRGGTGRGGPAGMGGQRHGGHAPLRRACRSSSGAGPGADRGGHHSWRFAQSGGGRRAWCLSPRWCGCSASIPARNAPASASSMWPGRD